MELEWHCQFVPFWGLYSVRKVVGLAVSAYALSVAYTLVLECVCGGVSICSFCCSYSIRRVVGLAVSACFFLGWIPVALFVEWLG